MLNFGPIKILFTAVAALLILGPKKIPDAVKGVTRALGELRKASKSVTEELKSGLELDDEASTGPPPVKTKASPKGPRALPPAEERRPGPRA